MENSKRSLRKFQIGVIVGGCLLVIIIGVTVLFGNRILKALSPKLYVEKAFLKTMGEIKSGTPRLSPAFAALLSGKWQQDIDISVNRLEGSLWDIDPLYLSFAEMITLKSSLRRDTATQTLSVGLALQLAVSKIAEITLFGDSEVIALHFPEAFDHAITVDPQRIVPEWDDSLLGAYLTPINGIIDGDAFYAYYQMALSAFPAKSEGKNLSSYTDSLLDLLKSVECQYVGAEENGEIFEMFIPEGALRNFATSVNLVDGLSANLPNDWIGATLNGLKNTLLEASIQEGVTMKVCIFDNKVKSLDYSFGATAAGKSWTVSGTASLRGEAANLDWVDASVLLESADETYDLRFVTESKVTQPDWLYNKTTGSLSSSRISMGAIDFDWEISWDQKVVADSNFMFAGRIAQGQKEEASLVSFGLGAEGRLIVGAPSGAAADMNDSYVDCSLKRLDINFQNSESFLDLSLNASYLLRIASGDITYNKANSIPLTKVGELDVLQMLGRLVKNPQWAMILGNVLN